MLRMLLVAGGMATLGALPVFLLGAQSVLMSSDLDFGERELGLAVGVFYAAAALAAAPAGAFVDRFGPRASRIAAGGLAALSTLGVAVLVRSLPGLLVMLAVAGGANAALQMTANSSLATSIPPARQGLAFGVKQSAVPFAILIGGLAVPTVGLVVGWRWTYAGAAVLAAMLMASGLYARTRAKEASRPREGLERAPRNALLVTAVATTLANGAANSLAAFLPAWTFRVGMDPGWSGVLLACCAGLSILGRVLSGAGGDRRSGRNIPVVAVQLGVGAMGFLLLLHPDVAVVVVGALVAFAFGWSWPGLLIFAVVRVGRDSPASASSAVQAGGFAGGALGPALFGWLVVQTSYPVGWVTAAAAMVVAATLLLCARRIFLKDIAVRPLRQ